MRINEFVGGSCAVAAIGDLSYCDGPEDALRRICKNALGKRRPAYFAGICDEYNKLTSFYVFSAGPEDSRYGNDWQNYGTSFAAYIKRHKLGKISTPGRFQNARYHAGHTCQAWIWAPDQKAVVAWWEKDQADKPKRRKRS